MFERYGVTKRLIWVNASVGLVLVIGFAVTVLVPRFALIRIGEARYGIYALIIGFSSVVAFADLGLTPGTTRQFAALFAEGKSVAIQAIVRRNQIISTQWLIVLAMGAAVVLFATVHTLSVDLAASFILFVASTWISILGGIRSSAVRAAGHVAATYWFQLSSLAAYLLVVVALFLVFHTWPGVLFLFVGQLAGSVVSFTLNDAAFHKLVPHVARAVPGHGTRVSDHEIVGEARDAWREAWRVSTPERFNRVIQLVMGFMERPLLVATAGLAFVGSYDLFMRLTLLVSALPGAVTGPVVAMLSHDAARPASQRKFEGALTFTRILNSGFALVGVGIALFLILGFYSTIFGVQSRVPIVLGILIVVTTGTNAVTAPGFAAMTARGTVGPCNAKLSIEAVGLGIGAAYAVYTHSGIAFVAFRYLSLLVASCSFIVMEFISTRGRANAN